MSNEGMDVIDMQSYDSGYVTGLMEGLNNGYEIGYQSYGLHVKKKEKEDRERRLYFLKQKLIGVLFLLATVLFVIVLEGDATIALFTVPIGLALIFCKSEVLRKKNDDLIDSIP